MTDVVYVLGIGSRFYDLELKYSLRSIEKHLKDVGNVYIVGEPPWFEHNCIHIPMDDWSPCKEKNILSKIKEACSTHSISDTFLFFNDDHFLNQDHSADTFPNYYNKSLEGLLSRTNPQSSYRISVKNTIDHLLSRNSTTHNFDCHTPIRYNRQSFLDINSTIPWEEQRNGFTIKSLYGNLMNLDKVQFNDIKINDHRPLNELKQSVADSPVFSIGDTGLEGGQIQILLQHLYPDKCKYER
jgi:hypothetical protein